MSVIRQSYTAKYSAEEQGKYLVNFNWEEDRASEAKYLIQRVVKPAVWFGFCVGVVTLCGYLWVMGY